MSQDPLEVVRAAEQRIAERIAVAARSSAAVDQARQAAERVLAAAHEAAVRQASALTEEILADGRADQEALRAAAAVHVQTLRKRALGRRAQDVAAVVCAVLPQTHQPLG
jgi:hypothetical protein